tara:strand:+ start:4075 stop:4854 length:780 start_codon:yes stop_codon:yes gene_type:complete
MNKSKNEIPEFIDFPRNVCPKVWTQYLGRRLKNQEAMILSGVKMEKIENKKLFNLYDIIEKNNLTISKLTPHDGNCLFESLIYHGLATDVDSIRRGLAYVMFQFKDYNNFFPTQETSLNELFNMTNEIEYVVCSNDENLYKYSFETMCQDLADDRSWDKLPTEIILMTISLIYKVKIIIYNNQNDWKNEINIWDGTEHQVKDIYIGHLLETHYLPLNKFNEDVPRRRKYLNAKKLFFDWGKFVANKLHEKKMSELKKSH